MFKQKLPVTLDPSGGTLTATSDMTVDEDGYGSMTVVQGGTLTLPTPAAPEGKNWTFIGWYFDDGKNDVCTDSTPITEEARLFALWKKTYKLTFDKNNSNATGSMLDQYFALNESQYLWGNGFSIPDTNYQFIGWNTKSDGSGLAYGDYNEFTWTDSTITTMILYAQWYNDPDIWDTTRTFAVNYHYNDGVDRDGKSDIILTDSVNSYGFTYPLREFDSTIPTIPLPGGVWEAAPPERFSSPGRKSP